MRSIEKAILNRTALLLGDAAMERVSAARVFIFGVGAAWGRVKVDALKERLLEINPLPKSRLCRRYSIARLQKASIWMNTTM